MLVQNLIDLINLEADELLDEDVDNIPYINNAIDFLNFKLAALKDIELLSMMDIAPGLPIPSNFIALVPANGYPLYSVNGVFNTTTGGTVKSVKYTSAKPHVSTITDTIPFRDIYSGLLVFTASYLIKKKSYIPPEYLNVDSAFIDQFMAVMSQAKGGS